MEETLTFHNPIILIKSAVNKNENNYHYDIFLEKNSYEDKSSKVFSNERLYIINAYFSRIDISEGIDVNKASKSKDCDICHYLYFLDKGFKFQPNDCHDFSLMSMNLSYIAILNTKGSDYRCTISGISKKEGINLMQNTDLTRKSRTS